jgi:single-strand DNA-binding protein
VAWCTISLATTRNWKNRESGERQEETEWHRVVFNDRLAEIAGEYLKKGRAVYVEGRLKTRKWTRKAATPTRPRSLPTSVMQLLGGRDGGGDEGGGGGGYCVAQVAAVVAMPAAVMPAVTTSVAALPPRALRPPGRPASGAPARPGPGAQGVHGL